jgi:uncharacterized protein (TIGR00369 family)
MKAKFPGYRDKVVASYNKQGIVHTLGIHIEDFGEGWFNTRMVPDARVTQHHGFVHAGALSTMADLSSGFAAYSLMDEKEEVLTIEYKINLLRPASGRLVLCRARVIKPGRRVYFSESEVYGINGAEEKLVAKALVTLAVI